MGRAYLNRALKRLRPHPHRGDVIAAGAVPLALFALVVELRMRQWSLGPRFTIVALIAALILTMGLLAELEGEAPRAYHSILLVSGLVPLALALVLLAEVMGAARPPGSGGIAWTFALEGLIAVLAARRANSAVCTLIAAIAGGISVEAFVTLVFKPSGLGTFRAMLVVLSLAYVTGAVRLRDSHRRHAVALVNAAGLAALVLGALYLLAIVLSPLLSKAVPGLFVSGASSAPFGWKLYLMAMGFGLIAYAAADREPGPGYIGAAVVVTVAVLASAPLTGPGSLIGWPLFLLVIGAAGLAIGLRPREPLPPPPGPREPAPTVPIAPSGGAAPTVPLAPVDSDE